MSHECRVFYGFFSILLTLVFSRRPCIDRPHFYYNCNDLAQYCRYPQAVRVRNSCPETCGLCKSPRSRATNIVSENPVITRPERRDNKPISPIRTVEENKWTSIVRQPPKRPAPIWKQPVVPVIGGQNIRTNDQQSNKRIRGIRRHTASFERPKQQSEPQFEGDFHKRPIVDVNALANSRLLRCCKLNRISSHCESLCSYDIGKEQILAKAGSGFCTIHDAQIWATCASGRKQNAHCCRNNGVTECDDMCNGNLNLGQMLHCVNLFLKPILKCHKQNYPY